MATTQRLGWEPLVPKTVVAGFLRAPLSESVLQTFENEVAKGRGTKEDYTVHVDRTGRAGATTAELWELCLQHFMSTDTLYNPYFFVILDERTAGDGTVIILHDSEPWGERKLGDPPEEMRVTPATIPCLLANLSIHELSIEDILINDRPDEEIDTWYYDVPFDHTANHHNVRLPLSEFENVEGRRDGFKKLRIADVSKLVPGYPSVPVKLEWFGEPPEEIQLECTVQRWGGIEGRVPLMTFGPPPV